jgi:hypothetical protein
LRLAAPASDIRQDAGSPSTADDPQARRERKRLRRKKKTPSRTGLVLALVMGGALLFVFVLAAGIGIYWRFGRGAGSEKASTASSAGSETRRILVGTWESTEEPKGAGRRKPVIAFKDDGTIFLVSGIEQLATTFRSLGMAGDFGLDLPAKSITYRLSADDRLEMEVDLSHIGKQLGADPATIARDYHKKETMTIAVSEKELSLTNDQGKSTKFRRLED